jgi:electron transport complex protein RnfC
MIGRCVEYDQFAQAMQYHPQHCLECGLCAYVCPSRRPLVQMIKMARKYGGERP